MSSPIGTVTPWTYQAVTRVVDGDTVKVGTVTVRVIGLDTPETVSPTVPDECGGAEATATAKELLLNEQVALVTDPTQGAKDKYGRTLAYVEIKGGGDFGLEMLKRGRGAEYTYSKPYQRQAIYKAAQAAAKAAHKGVWDVCGGVNTPLYRMTPR
jgi:micrococcal nuclease